MKKFNVSIMGVLFFVLLFISGCTESESVSKSQITAETESNHAVSKSIDADTELNAGINNQAEQSNPTFLNIYFIDVGQADACLLEYDEHFMLVDAGDNDDETDIVNFLNTQGVKTFDYVIGTHPHADHIGGMDAVIENFNIEKIYMPKVQTNTQTFEDVLTAIEQKGLSINTPIAGNEFLFRDIRIQILAPIKSYEDINNNSIVLKLTYGNTSCLFTGDIEADAETDIMREGDISANIIKIAHHGSQTSSTSNFIKAVNPQYAIISVGTDNTYGHPDETVISRLEDQEIQIYRTDKRGTIKISTDGNAIEFSTDKNAKAVLQDIKNEQANLEENTEIVPKNDTDIQYIGNKNSKKFHLPSCSTLPAEKNKVIFETREDAVTSGYQSCKNCDP